MKIGDLVNAVSEDCGLSKKDSTVVVKSVLDNIIKGVVEDGEVQLINYFTFKTREVAERMGRNPQTGKEMLIEAHKQVSTSIGKKFKDSVKNS